MSLLLNLLIFLNDILLDLLHFITVALDCHQFIVGFSRLDLVENLEDLLIFVHDVDKAQFLLFILTYKADKFTTLLNFVERLHEFVGEILYPFDILVLYFNQSVTNTFLPFANDGDIWLVFLNGLGSVGFDSLELLKLVLILFVNIVEILRRHDTFKTLVLLLSL